MRSADSHCISEIFVLSTYQPKIYKGFNNMRTIDLANMPRRKISHAKSANIHHSAALHDVLPWECRIEAFDSQGSCIDKPDVKSLFDCYNCSATGAVWCGQFRCWRHLVYKSVDLCRCGHRVDCIRFAVPDSGSCDWTGQWYCEQHLSDLPQRSDLTVITVLSHWGLPTEIIRNIIRHLSTLSDPLSTRRYIIDSALKARHRSFLNLT